MPHEHRIVCGGASGRVRAGKLSFTVDGVPFEASLVVSRLSKQLVSDLPDVVADLLEVAAFVYAADAAIPRGGATAGEAGAHWRRNMHLRVPVRCLEVWSRPEIVRQLAEILGFLSEDHYAFEFIAHDRRPIQETIPFEFGSTEGWVADEVILFSGGLDSFAGALEAVLERRSRVALVSHQSAPVMKTVQSKLARRLASIRRDQDLVRHFPVRATMKSGQKKEGTHRSRSFLFAALGLAVARAFDRRQVSFYENGVVSLNLPLLAQFVGTRATRSTHPEALAGMSDFFSVLLGTRVEARNPFFLRTKRDVVSRIADLGHLEAIAQTRSCAKVRSVSRQYPHCGVCSQCIDRRFAVLAAGLAESDPAEAYAVDLLDGPRHGADRELALAYVRQARAYRAMFPAQLLRHHPEVARALDREGLAPEEALKQTCDLLNRHGRGVTEIMEAALERRPARSDSLVALYTSIDLDPGSPQPVEPQAPTKVLLEIDTKAKKARIDGHAILQGTKFTTLEALAAAHLNSLGEGRVPEEFELLSVRQLCSMWKIDEESSVRRRIKALRSSLGDRGEALIESLPWHGYRLAPERVVVRRADLAATPLPRESAPESPVAVRRRRSRS